MRLIEKALPAVLVAVCVCGGCKKLQINLYPKRDTPLAAWVASDMVALTSRTTPTDDPALFDEKRKAVSLFAAANETVSFQVVVDAGPEGIKGLKLSWTDLTGPDRSRIPADRIRPFRMLPLPVRKYPAWYLRLVEEVPAPAEVYDPLLPIDPKQAQSFDVDPNGRLALWIDLAVPRGAPGGQYTGSMTLSAKGREDWAAALALDVRSFVLPDTRPVPAVGGFDHRELFRALMARDGKPFDPVRLDRKNPLVRKGLVLIRQLMRMAHDHRLDLFDTQIRPIMKRTGNGGVTLQWADYDAVVGPYLDGIAFDDRIGCAAWPVPLSEQWPKPEYYGGAASPAYAKVVESYLTACRDHFADKVQVGKQVFLWPCRDPTQAEAYATHARLASIARRVDANTPILCQLPLIAPEGSGWHVPAGFRGLVDILAPRGELLDPAAGAPATGMKHPLAGVWLSPGTPPYVPSLGILAKPWDVRALPWFAMKYQCTGLLVPNVLHWSPASAARGAGSEARLFYPGTPVGVAGPLPSVRLKRLRRGLQDIAYLWILQKRDRAGVARAMINSLVRYAGLAAAGDNYLDPRLDGWVSDGRTWTLARRILSEEAQAVVRPELANRTRTLAHRLAWEQFGDRTRALRVEQVRSLVRPAAGSDPGRLDKLHLTVLLEVYNQYGSQALLDANFAEVSAGWRPLPASGRPVAVAAGSRGVVRLEAEGPGPIPTQPNGTAPVLIRLASNVEKDRPVLASVGFLRVGVVKEPPKIDGLLNDWPPRVGNTARDFRLLGRRGRKGDGLARRKTMAFLLRDDTKLYLAFRCEEPDPAGVVKKPSNVLKYEQLIPVGEDLVEALFDPGGKAAGPEDLYHLAIKPNGILIAERGVGCDPPLGRVRPWSASATVAIAEQKNAWTVEVAIPLAAFGDRAKDAFWRVNFTRYATQGAEASSWSGARRHFYDPRDLGTMFMGAEALTGKRAE